MVVFQYIIQNALSSIMKEIDAQGFDSDHFDIKVELKSDKYKVGLAGEIKEQDGKINIAKGEH